MPESVAQLASLHLPLYRDRVKASLRDDEMWIVLIDPILVERTREVLVHMVNSIDAQIVNYNGLDPRWLRNINGLRKFCKARLDTMPPSLSPITSGNREARAWRATSARLAAKLAEYAPEELETIQAPYGGQSVGQWLSNREGKQAS